MAGRQTLTANSQLGVDAHPARRWTIAAALAFAGALNPTPLPMTGLHKFYLGQPIWGGIYLVLWWTQIPRVACAVEGVWYLTRARLGETADSVASPSDGVAVSQQTQAIATALRELEKLRQEGLISEEEFEQNRRNLLARLG